eukprot:2129805-Amphidinium_carterae.2
MAILKSCFAEWWGQAQMLPRGVLPNGCQHAIKSSTGLWYPVVRYLAVFEQSTWANDDGPCTGMGHHDAAHARARLGEIHCSRSGP